MRVSMTVNGRLRQAEAEPRMTLADFLRDRLRLTGTHLGCEQGACGACTVLLGGQAVRACLVLAVQAEGAEVRTVEGMSNGSGLSPLQEAFRKHAALQCGFCTPGFLVSAQEILDRGERLEEDEIRRELSGNVCRCTGYAGIVKAVQECQG
ncbi:(2Fe-2S)-binding protein [Amycolatopsis jejuensis]|uniref:(2Fe-2S)-binding protein n=1 Tax=Amycolatopsis jejuensis TaxID=330084 RepID=UPI0005244259|nr:(2Fe-2S)-binding protein [Amycolatopsis jejuensis]